MKSFSKLLLLFLLVASTSINSISQSRFNIHVGSAFPLSDFGLYGANNTMSDPTIGINTGMRYSYIFSSIGIGAFAGMDFMYNGISKEFKEEVEQSDAPFMEEDPIFHKYYNIPFSTGICYDFRLNENLLLSSNAGLTVNCFLISDSKYWSSESSTDPAFSVGGRIRAGLIIKDRVSISVDYLGLGNHTVSGEATWGLFPTTEEFTTELKIHMLTLTAGIYF